MAHRKTLTDGQMRVLRWIDDGCPEGVMTDDFHRISAAALRNRGLVETSGRGPTWTATITLAGHNYLESAAGPNPPVPRQGNTSVTEQLVMDVIAAGGSLRVPRRTWNARGVDWERRVQLAHYHGKVPPGKWPTVSRASAEELQIDLVEAPDDSARLVRPVPVPERVTRYHPVVRQLRESAQPFLLSRGARPRMLRVLHGLVVEAERRGYDVRVPPARPGRFASAPTTARVDGQLVIAVGEYAVTVRASEEGIRSHAVVHRPGRSPAIDESEATGRLVLELNPRSYGLARPARWADRRSWTLEQKLPNLLREIEIRAIEHEKKRLAAEREAAERHARWQQALTQALERYAEQQKVEALAEQLRRWREARDVRNYCAEVAEAHLEDAEVQEWLSWSRIYADALDPVPQRPTAPPVRQVVPPEELRPFLDGWDPHQPVRR